VTGTVARYESRGDTLATKEDNRWTVAGHSEARAGTANPHSCSRTLVRPPSNIENVVVVPGDDRIAVFDHGVEIVRGIYHRDGKRFSIAPPPPQLNPH